MNEPRKVIGATSVLGGMEPVYAETTADMIRRCFTCGLDPLIQSGFVDGCEELGHDVADALVIRADQPVYRIDEKVVSATYDDMLAIRIFDIDGGEGATTIGALRRIGADDVR